MRGGAVTATDFPVTVGCSAPELGKGLLSWGDSVDGGHLRDRRPAPKVPQRETGLARPMRGAPEAQRGALRPRGPELRRASTREGGVMRLG